MLVLRENPFDPLYKTFELADPDLLPVQGEHLTHRLHELRLPPRSVGWFIQAHLQTRLAIKRLRTNVLSLCMFFHAGNNSLKQFADTPYSCGHQSLTFTARHEGPHVDHGRQVDELVDLDHSTRSSACRCQWKGGRRISVLEVCHCALPQSQHANYCSSTVGQPRERMAAGWRPRRPVSSVTSNGCHLLFSSYQAESRLTLHLDQRKSHTLRTVLSYVRQESYLPLLIQYYYSGAINATKRILQLDVQTQVCAETLQMSLTVIDHELYQALF